MINFNDKIILEFTGGKKQYRQNPLMIRTRVFEKQLDLKDDEYFVYEIKPAYTDEASIPRILWSFITPIDWRVLNPSQPHDQGYEKLREALKQSFLDGDTVKVSELEVLLHGCIWNKRTGKIVKENIVPYATRKDFDLIMKEKMGSYGAGWLLINAVYWILRAVGGRAIK